MSLRDHQPPVNLRPFEIAPTLEGHEVVAKDTGRPVTGTFTGENSAQRANGHAQFLNNAALNGPRALARAMRAA